MKSHSSLFSRPQTKRPAVGSGDLLGLETPQAPHGPPFPEALSPEAGLWTALSLGDYFFILSLSSPLSLAHSPPQRSSPSTLIFFPRLPPPTMLDRRLLHSPSTSAAADLLRSRHPAHLHVAVASSAHALAFASFTAPCLSSAAATSPSLSSSASPHTSLPHPPQPRLPPQRPSRRSLISNYELFELIYLDMDMGERPYSLSCVVFYFLCCHY